MDPSNIGSCPHCRQPIDLEASVCAQCMRSTLTDVVLQSALPDPRSRYRVSRALLALGEGAPALTALQSRLGSGRGAVASGVTRAVAERAAEIVRAAGGVAVIRLAQAGTDREDGGGRRTLWLAGAGLAALLAMAVLAAVLTRGGGPDPPSTGGESAAPSMTPEKVAARGLPATVALSCGDQAGSGFFVTRDLLITNAHVLCDDSSSVDVRFSDGRESTGTVETVDEGLDLAVVRAPGLEAEPIPLGDAGSLSLGQRLTMIGSPLGLDFSVHECGVSNLERNDLGLAFVQIDASVNPGNSGGPLIDRRGRVVGVVTLKMIAGEGIGLAVPINYAYTGPNPLVDGPSEEPTPGFERMRARAEAASRQEAEELLATGQRPGLVAAAARGHLMAADLIWPSNGPPVVQAFNFMLVKGDEPICEMTGTVSGWERLEAKGQGPVLPPRVTRWLETHGFSADLYHGVAVMRWDHCPADQLDGVVDLELENADDDARRVRFGV